MFFIQFQKEQLFFSGHRAKDYGNILPIACMYRIPLRQYRDAEFSLSPKKAEQYFVALFDAIWPFPNFIVL